RGVELALGNLLQERLEVAAVRALCHLLDLRAEVLEDERARRLETAVEIDSRHQRFKYVRQQARRHHRMQVHPFAEKEEVTEVEDAANAGTSSPADDHRFDLRQIAFLIVGEALKELFAGDEAEHSVAEKL